LYEDKASQPDFAVFLNVFASPRLVLASPHAVLEASCVVLEPSRVVLAPLQVVLAWSQFVLALGRGDAPLMEADVALRHVVGAPLDVVLPLMQLELRELRVVLAMRHRLARRKFFVEGEIQMESALRTNENSPPIYWWDQGEYGDGVREADG
jgi:hypothetical protein